MTRTRLSALLSLLLLVSLLLSACNLASPTPTPTGAETPVASETPPPTGEDVIAPAVVDNLEVLLLESFPVQVQVVARGALPDSCTTLVDATVQRQGNTFQVLLNTRRPAEAACATVLTPFEQVIPLDVVGLKAGVYTVDVNGLPATFELQVDNLPVEEPTVTPTSAPLSEIGGLLWHDLCAVSGGVGDEPLNPSEGCVEITPAVFAADAVKQDAEPVIAGVEVRLTPGECPTGGLPASGSTTTTAADGKFIFKDLPAGLYCLSIDPASPVNAALLSPGEFTFPSREQAAVTLDLASGVKRQDLNFGWDYANLPVPENAANCTDRLVFVDDITIPDDSPFTAGTKFTKTWELRNEGTCTWTTAYSLVFKEGDQMSAASPIKLTSPVPPKATVQLSVELTAPADPGTYRGDWLLQNPAGNTFGAGSKNESFWVQVKVIESVSDLGLGSPDWTDSFNSAGTWYLVDSTDVKFTVDDGKLVMTAINSTSGEQWGLSTHGPIDDFYMEATVTTGEACAGRDRYGLLVRAPDPNAGYVFGFACDGRYRIYKWDGQNYNALIEWTADANILAGPNKTNKIGILADGDTLKLYANGALLATLTDSSYSQGSFGMFVGSGGTSNFEASVEEISYWNLDD